MRMILALVVCLIGWSVEGTTEGHADRLLTSWYHEGARTANGERFKPDGLTAAHRTLPFGTRIKVTRLDNGRSVTVRINDRGPAEWTGRGLDLSRGAAKLLGIIKAGIARVIFDIL